MVYQVALLSIYNGLEKPPPGDMGRIRYVVSSIPSGEESVSHDARGEAGGHGEHGEGGEHGGP